MQKRIGFAGLGLMGSRMARQPAQEGLPLTVWNRTPERCAPLAAAGARVAATPRELAEALGRRRRLRRRSAGRRAAGVRRGRPARRGARPGFRYLECSTVIAAS